MKPAEMPTCSSARKNPSFTNHDLRYFAGSFEHQQPQSLDLILLHSSVDCRLIMANAPGGYDGSPSGVDLATFPAAARLVERVGQFMKEVQHL